MLLVPLPSTLLLTTLPPVPSALSNAQPPSLQCHRLFAPIASLPEQSRTRLHSPLAHRLQPLVLLPADRDCPRVAILMASLLSPLLPPPTPKAAFRSPSRLVTSSPVLTLRMARRGTLTLEGQSANICPAITKPPLNNPPRDRYVVTSALTRSKVSLPSYLVVLALVVNQQLHKRLPMPVKKERSLRACILPSA